MTDRRTERHARDAQDATARIPAPSAPPDPELQEGSRIGRYAIGRRLGQGAMGSVMVAEQLEPVRRRVAFKVLHLGMNTEELLRRFHYEQRVLAMLDHPNVATMLDAGATAKGRPYFVMEYVDGLRIDTYCDRNSLTVHQRIDLFLQVLAGVESAHQKGIIHRDLKPSNILVSERGDAPTAKIIDFGIAKSMGSELNEEGPLTRLGQVFGTPRYMAPEQVERSSDHLDVRTDVFSLGVVLYELLVGVSPFNGASASDDLAEISTRQAVAPARILKRSRSSVALIAKHRGLSPSSLAREVSGDLASVLLKALERARADRYRTVSEFADDLKRYRDGYPVIAKTQTFWYTARRFAGRRRGLIATTSLVAVVLVGTTLAAVVGFVRAERSAQEARAAAERTAQVAEFQARQLESIDVARMGSDLRRGVLDAIRDAAAAQGIDSQGINARSAQAIRLMAGADFTTLALDTLEKTIFDPALIVIERDYADQPLVQAALFNTIADTARELGRLDAAEAPQIRAIEILRDRHGPDHPETLAAREQLGQLRWAQGRHGESEAILRDVLERSRRELGERHRVTLLTLGSLGVTLRDAGKLEDAESILREALQRTREVLGERDELTVLAVINVGFVLQAQGRAEDAQPYYQQGLELARSVLGDGHPVTMSATNNLGSILQDLGRLDEAEPLYRDALRSRRAVLGNQHPTTLVSLNNLGLLLMRSGRLDEALPLFEENLATSREVMGATHPATLRALNSMAALYSQVGDFDQAESAARELVRQTLQTLGREHVYSGVFLNTHGSVLLGQGRFEEARAALQESYDILTALGAARYVERPINAMVTLYEKWAIAEPDQGHAETAEVWRSRLSETD